MATTADDVMASRRVDELELEAPLPRRLLAEFVGTLLFVGVGTGAATVAAVSAAQRFAGAPREQLADPVARSYYEALFAANFGDLLPVALAFATALAALVYAFGGVSGAHFNPAVTLALAVSRRFRLTEVLPYWVAQCLGGIAGTIVVAGIYKDVVEPLADSNILFGGTVVSDGIGFPQALLAEAFIGFILMTAIMAIAVDHRAPKGWSGLIIGLALAGGILVTAAATGGSANFARSLGPFVTSLLFDAGDIPWGDLAVYALGPAIGAAAAALIYEGVTGLERVAPEPGPGAATGSADAPIVGTPPASTARTDVETPPGSSSRTDI